MSDGRRCGRNVGPALVLAAMAALARGAAAQTTDAAIVGTVVTADGRPSAA